MGPPTRRRDANYVKTLAGGPERRRGVGADAQLFARARTVLRRFDLVLVLEGFGDPDYDGWWADRLALEDDLRMPHRNQTTRLQSLYDIRDHLTEPQRRDAVARNRWDLALYRETCLRSPVPASTPVPGAPRQRS